MKSYAIELFFDEPFDSFVRDLWRTCNLNHLTAFASNIDGLTPHIALAVYSNVEASDLLHKFNQLKFTPLNRFTILFDALAIFPKTNVTFYQPNTTERLLDIMKLVHQNLEQFSEYCHPYYSELHWFPHVTIAYNDSIDATLRTLAFLLNRFQPIETTVTSLALVELTYENNSCISSHTLSEILLT